MNGEESIFDIINNFRNENRKRILKKVDTFIAKEFWGIKKLKNYLTTSTPKK